MEDVKVTVHRVPPSGEPYAADFGYVQGKLGGALVRIPCLLKLIDHDPAGLEAIKNQVRFCTRIEAERIEATP